MSSQAAVNEPTPDPSPPEAGGGLRTGVFSLPSLGLSPDWRAGAYREAPSCLYYTLLMLPTLLLGVAFLIASDRARVWAAFGWVIELVGALWWTLGAPLAPPGAGPALSGRIWQGRVVQFLPVGVFSLVAAIWFWHCPPDPAMRWYVPLAHGLLLAGPSVLLAWEFAVAAGLPELRRSRRLIRQLQRRRKWPDSPTDFRSLPEVRALRQALRLDPTPAWMLLSDPRKQVRLAGLAALEFRPTWKPGQAEAVLRMFHEEDDVPLRAAAVRALGGTEDPYLLELFRRLLHDPARRVRRAAIEVVLRSAGRHWGRYRESVHRILGDPRFAGDGPLNHGLRLPLPDPAVHDLIAWAGEPGPASIRSTLTLVAYFRYLLTESPSEELVHGLRGLVADPKVPAIVRVELAHLLRAEEVFDRAAYQRMLQPDQPGALRVLAAEALLLENPRYAPAVEVLRGLARQPNRELALSVAAVVQRCLRIDLGLPWGQPPPSPQSRQAADVTRRVMAWAAEGDQPAPAAPLPVVLSEGSFEFPALPNSPPPARPAKPEISEWEW